MKLDIIEDSKMAIVKEHVDGLSCGTCAMTSIITHALYRLNAQIVNMFADWYRSLRFIGASSDSRRWSAITQWARKIITVCGSLRCANSSRA